MKSSIIVQRRISESVISAATYIVYNKRKNSSSSSPSFVGWRTCAIGVKDWNEHNVYPSSGDNTCIGTYSQINRKRGGLDILIIIQDSRSYK